MKSDYVLEADAQVNPTLAMQYIPPNYQERQVQVNKAENGYVIIATVHGVKGGQHYHKTTMWIANSEPFIGDYVKAAYEWDPQ